MFGFEAFLGWHSTAVRYDREWQGQVNHDGAQTFVSALHWRKKYDRAAGHTYTSHFFFAPLLPNIFIIIPCLYEISQVRKHLHKVMPAAAAVRRRKDRAQPCLKGPAVTVDGKQDVSQNYALAAQKANPCPGLHQKMGSHQGKGGDPSPLLCTGEVTWSTASKWGVLSTGET